MHYLKIGNKLSVTKISDLYKLAMWHVNIMKIGKRPVKKKKN